LPPESKGAALAGDPIAVSKVLATPTEIAITAEPVQQRRLARLFFLTSATAAIVARLAYGAAQ
jgi:hypothetical protein